jgi:2-oxoglutarate ferredoxin oxidoreductase subunit alpha
MDLKAETMGLAVAVELPLVIIDIQRSGPSTGMPTKTEQADLMLALHGRHGEAPVPVLAPATPAECFAMVYEAVRIAVTYMTPVIVLTDGYLANGSEPWLIPDVGALPDISTTFAEATDAPFEPYLRDPDTLARPWAIPGTAGLEHRIGGLEKADVTGTISYDPDNHDHMVRLRAQKVAGIAADIPELEVDDPDGDAELLVLGWGSTYGPIVAGVRRARKRGIHVARVHLHHLNPFPRNTGDVLRRYPKVLVPEMNLGQLALLLRAEFLVDAVSYTKVRGRPLGAGELEEAIAAMVGSS